MHAVLGTAHQIGVTVGLLTVQVVTTPSLCPLGYADNWRYLFLVPCFCSLVQCAVLPRCPESPAFSADGSGLVRAPSSTEHSMTGLTLIETVLARPLRKQLLVGTVLMVSMQLSGIDAIFLYSTMALRRVGMAEPQLASVWIAAVNVALVPLAVAFMNAAGRRTLLLGSWLGMCLSYLLITAAFVAIALLDAPMASMHTIAVIGMIGAVACFSVGPGCIAWFVISEIFPAHARQAAMTLSIALNWLANWLVALAFPTALDELGPAAFLLFAGSTALFGVFTYRMVPETRNRPYAQIQDDFERLQL